MYFSAAAPSENGLGDHAVEGSRHEGEDRMLDPRLDRGDGMPGVTLVPGPVEVFGYDPQLDDKVCREVLRPDLAPFLRPQPDQGLLTLPPAVEIRLLVISRFRRIFRFAQLHSAIALQSNDRKNIT
jgi:hypothetical protein